MILTTKLLKVYVNDKDKQGNPLVNSYGKPYRKIAITTDAHEGQWLSGFINKPSDPMNTWKVGDMVDIVVTMNGQWLNFQPASELDLLTRRVENLEKLREANDRSPETDEVNADLAGDDLPF